jgi:hypothetical protein
VQLPFVITPELAPALYSKISTFHVRSRAYNRPKSGVAPCPFCDDCVEKLENRAAPKISQMQRIDDFSRCNAL